MILVVGGTGTVGSQVVKGLCAAGEEVRALVRSEDKAAAVEAAGASAVIGDLDAPETLPGALAGVDRAFLVSPVAPEQAQRETAFVEAIAAAEGVHLVKVSVIGADPDSPARFIAQHGRVERAVRESGIEHTFLRPNDFMQNALFWAPSIAADGRVYTPNADSPMASVDARDVAEAAVAVLTRTAQTGHVYELSGPEALTRREQVATVAAALGRDVEAIAVSNDQAREGMLAAGFPPYVVDGLHELWVHVYDAGHAAAVTDGVREATGREPTSWDGFARAHADVWR